MTSMVFIYNPNQNSFLSISGFLEKCLINGEVKEGTSLKMFLEISQPSLLPKTDEPFLKYIRNNLTSILNAENQNHDADCACHGLL